MTVRHIEETDRQHKQKAGVTDLVFILDKSGSMTGLESDSIGGFNAMIETHRKKPGACLITTVLFDSEYQLLHDRTGLRDVKPMTDRDFEAGGCTALYDAVGLTIHKIRAARKQAALQNQTGQVMFVIMTDGLENASRRFTLQQVRTMIEHERAKHGWEFLFLGASFDAAETAETLGIRRDLAAEYLADSQGMQVSFQAMSRTLESFRDTGVADTACMQVIREDTRVRSGPHPGRKSRLKRH
nr:hypothetical protein [Faecalibaculum rodentium]